MTNEQLYLAIGLPTILSIIFNGAFFIALNGRMSALENRITAGETRMENRMSGLENRMAALEARITAFEAAMITRFDELMRTLFALESRITALETRLSR